MQLVYVNSDYISYLRRFDNRVRMNKSHRPYLGIVLNINGFQYFAPLESAKPGKRISSQIAFNVWDNPNTDDNPISFLLLNDMIPVARNCYTPINFDSEKQNNFKKYTLLLAEVNYIRPRKEAIMRRARKVYVNRTEKHIPFIKQMCLDFKDLENRLKEYLDR